MRARTLLATIAATAFLLAGCGGESPKPKAYSRPSKSATATSATPSPSPPPSPTAASKAGNVTAQQFVKYYLDTFGYSSNSGDTAPLKKLGLARCESCAGVIKAIRSVYDAGGSSHGVIYRASGMRVEKNPKGVSVYATLQISPQTLKESTKSKTVRVKGLKTKTRFDLISHDGSWLVYEWSKE